MIYVIIIFQLIFVGVCIRNLIHLNRYKKNFKMNKIAFDVACENDNIEEMKYLIAQGRHMLKFYSHPFWLNYKPYQFKPYKGRPWTIIE